MLRSGNGIEDGATRSLVLSGAGHWLGVGCDLYETFMRCECDGGEGWRTDEADESDSRVGSKVMAGGRETVEFCGGGCICIRV